MFTNEPASMKSYFDSVAAEIQKLVFEAAAITRSIRKYTILQWYVIFFMMPWAIIYSYNLKPCHNLLATDGIYMILRLYAKLYMYDTSSLCKTVQDPRWLSMCCEHTKHTLSCTEMLISRTDV